MASKGGPPGVARHAAYPSFRLLKHAQATASPGADHPPAPVAGIVPSQSRGNKSSMRCTRRGEGRWSAETQDHVHLPPRGHGPGSVALNCGPGVGSDSRWRGRDRRPWSTDPVRSERPCSRRRDSETVIRPKPGAGIEPPGTAWSTPMARRATMATELMNVPERRWALAGGTARSGSRDETRARVAGCGARRRGRTVFSSR